MRCRFGIIFRTEFARDRQCKFRSDAFAALDGDSSTEQLGEFFRDVQTDADAAETARLGAVNLVEFIEDLAQPFARNTHAGVGYFKFKQRTLRTERRGLRNISRALAA